MSKKGHFQKEKQTGSGGKKALIIILVIVIVLAVIGTAAYFFLNSNLKKIGQAQFEEKGSNAELDAMAGGAPLTEPVTDETEPADETEAVTTEATETTTEPETTAAPTEPDYGDSGKIINIMVVGQDFREDEAHKLADTMMLFTLNKETSTLTVTSFLRDSYVKLPDYYRGHTCGWNRINTAYALGYGWFGDAGAMDMLNVTIQNNYGIEIDGDVEISLEVFEKVIDIFGGITINLEGDELTYMDGVADAWMPLYGPEANIHHFDEGDNLLNGREALWYARMRHSNGADSDIKRAARQRLIIDKVMEKVKSMNLLEMKTILDEVLPLITTNITSDEMMMYIKEVLPCVFNLQVVSNQCPAEGTYWGEMVELPDGLSGVLKINFEQNRILMREICEEAE